ncbi:unnamed protein product [Phytophthora lilii]|uniref:Unnamed protein product n=1 Tax=Phytophthora lilii TaxID=2077276 RepID=A0A9W6TMT6_9STRA|nr:unnamed protein product [Phytophthora lilii]
MSHSIVLSETNKLNKKPADDMIRVYFSIQEEVTALEQLRFVLSDENEFLKAAKMDTAQKRTAAALPAPDDAKQSTPKKKRMRSSSTRSTKALQR